MRSTTYAFLVAVAGAAVASFAGCGGDVVTPGGGGSGGSTGAHLVGGGGATGTTVTVTGTTSSVVTGSTGIASSSSGSTNPKCDQGCAHAAQCGFDICKQFNINCNAIGSQYDCVLDCVNALPCDQLQQGALGCYQTCQGGGSSSSSGGFGGTCQGCTFQKCGSTIQPVAMTGWGQCALGCEQQNPTPQCFSDCDAQNPNDAAKYAPVYQCLCTSCGSQCGAQIDPCNHLPDAGP